MYQQVLKILNNRQIYTTKQLVTKLSISAKKLKEIIDDLVSYGIKLDNPTSDTYQIIETVDLLDIRKIRAELTNKSVNLEIFDVVDSTNEHILAQTSIIEKPLVYIAEYQTSGRGRQGSKWVSPYASGLCLSIKYSYTDLNILNGLSIALAVTIAKMLYDLGIYEIGLKWPNDLLWRQRKLAGLLLENRCKKKCEIVVGIGINVRMSLVNDISQPWIDLVSISKQIPTRNTLAANLIDSCLSTLLNYPNTGLNPFLDDWKRFDLSYGKSITLYNSNGGTIKGIATGINEYGSLLINNKSYTCGSLIFN
ncbi:MAG: biotin--[acetyl-CoA-carboxylase] ligase [Candidatus Marithrix sp.]